MMDIERWQGDAKGRSRATRLARSRVRGGHGARSDGCRADPRESRADLGKPSRGGHRIAHGLLSATVYLTDIANKAQMDAEWCEWIGDSANWPQRACVQAELAPGTLVEITVVAARPQLSVP